MTFDDAADLAGVDHDPVADGRIGVARDRAQRSVPVVNQVVGAIVPKHTGDDGAGRGDPYELFGEAGIPAQ